MEEFRDLQALNQARMYFIKQANQHPVEHHKHTYYLKKAHLISGDIYEYFEQKGFVLTYSKPNLGGPGLFIQVEALNLLHYMAFTDNFYCLDKLLSKVDETTMKKFFVQKESGFITHQTNLKQKNPIEMILIKKAYKALMKLDSYYDVIDEQNIESILTSLVIQPDNILGKEGQDLVSHIIAKPLFEQFMQKSLSKKVKNTNYSSFGNADYYSYLEDMMARAFSFSSFEKLSNKIMQLNLPSKMQLLSSILEQRFVNTIKLATTTSRHQVPILQDVQLNARLLSIMSYYKKQFNLDVDLQTLQLKDSHIVQKMFDFAYKTPQFYYATKDIFDYTKPDHEGNNLLNYIFKELGKYVPSTDIQQDLVINLVQSNQFDLEEAIQKPKFYFKNVKQAFKAISEHAPIKDFPPLNRFKILLEKVLLTQSMQATESEEATTKVAIGEQPRKRMKI